MSYRQTGFGLLELVVALAIVAILAALAYPSYRDYAQRGYRSDALQALMDEAARQERIKLVTGQYSVREPYPSAGGRYEIEPRIDVDGLSFYLLARPQGAQTEDPCGTLTLDHRGGKRIEEADDSADPARCWQSG